ncbi:hypothetical protein ACFFMN_09565 [Planobispora siamensis]|uniref:Uncharacterized protein n=1 Tax=Planobispora siamensis TaxID=936338 RepID=A0A8J3SEP4_9ACTN|nr:hypothetical protein [Planobispora siamensis]GIH91236.1 hypothetical protein Psi01_18660 [Planobispora siamensis]
MILKIARAAAFTVLPVELLLVILLVSGVSLPTPVIAVAEAAVAAVLLLEAVAARRLYRAERRAGAGRGEAARATVRRLVPEQVRRLMAFDAKGMVSLVLWAARRRDGVPPGSVAVSYSREQATMMTFILFLMVVETVALEVLLRAWGVPDGLRMVVLVVDVYSIFIGLAVGAACVTRPHVVSARELRVRYGAFFDLRIPRELISSVRQSRNYNESGMVAVKDGRLSVAVSSQTNVVVELEEPITIVRPLGGRAEVTVVRFFADTPGAALAALRPAQHHDA